jgi:hypothetical protein
MVVSRIFEGAWDELSKHADQLREYPKLTLIVPTQAHVGDGRYWTDLPVEERIQALDAAAEKNRNLPALSADAFNRENLYSDDSERV